MDAFEAHRPHLHAVATRILGSRAEADDALQEGGGDFAGLLAVLDPDVVLRTDEGGGALRIIAGARAVAANARLFATTRVPYPAIVDGAAGFVATEAGLPVAVLAFTVHDGRITAIDALGGPDRVAALGLDAFVAGETGG